MFDFLKRKKQIDVQGPIRRVIDLTNPSMPRFDESRYARRYPRTLPVILCEVKNNHPNLETMIIGITRELSDSGVGVIIDHAIEPSEKDYTVTIWPNSDEFDSPYHFIGHIKRCTKFSHAQYSLGISIYSMIEEMPKNFRNAMDNIYSEILHPTLDD